jgi:hypothetical protein
MKQLKRLEPRALTRMNGPKTVRRRPLEFVPEADNPLFDQDLSGNNEQRRKKELDAVGKAFSKASKQISGRDALSGYGVDYCCVVFHDADQVDAFLRGVGYPEPKDHYIDGPILADILGITLPEPKVAISKLKRTHNPRLTQLAAPLRRGS